MYVTRPYGGYFALCATSEDDSFGVVEVDLWKLNPNNFYPDEDFTEQAGRTPLAEELGLKSMEERSEWVRDNLSAYKATWKLSLENLGNMSHRGPIPPKAITRVSIFDPHSNPGLVLALADPTITIMNATIVGQKYELLTKWLMGENVGVEEYITSSFGMAGAVPVGKIEDMMRGVREATEEMLAKKDGLEVITRSD